MPEPDRIPPAVLGDSDGGVDFDWDLGDVYSEPEPVHHITANFLAGIGPAERTAAARLAEARQALAARGTGYLPAWAELTDDERATSTVAALHYLRAAREIGLAR